MDRLYVTGIDTDVGKTGVTACLAEALRASGRAVRAAKPVASGAAPGTSGEDAARLAEAAGHEPLVYATFAAPLAPHRAARLEARRVDPEALVAWLLGLPGDPLLVEGVGGWRVPLTERLQLCDVVRRAPGPVLVVAADRLGVLNHTLLTLEAIRRDGARVAGVVLNRGVGASEDPARRWNLDDLTELVDVPVVPLDRVDLTDAAARRRAGEALLGQLPIGSSETGAA